MKKIAIIAILIIILISIAATGLYMTKGTKVTLHQGWYHTEGFLNPFDDWEWHVVSVGMTISEGDFISIPAYVPPGNVKIEGILSPSSSHYPQWDDEEYRAYTDTGRTSDTILGATIPFSLEWNRVDLHGQDGLWMELSLTAYEGSSCLPWPFPRWCWAESPLPDGTIYALRNERYNDCVQYGGSYCDFPINHDSYYWHDYPVTLLVYITQED